MSKQLSMSGMNALKPNKQINSGTYISPETGSKMLAMPGMQPPGPQGVPQSFGRPDFGETMHGKPKSKQLSMPVEDDTLIGGFSNLNGMSLDSAKNLSRSQRRLENNPKDSRAAQAEAMFGGIYDPFQNEDDELTF